MLTFSFYIYVLSANKSTKMLCDNFDGKYQGWTFLSQVCHIAIYGRRGGRWPVWWVFHCGKPQQSIKHSRKLWPDQSVYHKWCWSQKGTLASFCDMPRAPCQLLMFHYHQRQIIRILLTIQQYNNIAGVISENCDAGNLFRMLVSPHPVLYLNVHNKY